MKCRDCPYGKEDFERRMYNYNKIIKDRGIPNDIYYDLKPEDAADEFEQFLWCDKVGGKVYCFGHCTDFYKDTNTVNNQNSSKQKMRNKRERCQKYKEHLKRLYEIAYKWYPSPVYYTDKIYVRGYGYIENPKPYYKRLYRGKGSKYLKKQSHRKIRRYKGELHNGWLCHRIYDFWWKYC